MSRVKQVYQTTDGRVFAVLAEATTYQDRLDKLDRLQEELDADPVYSEGSHGALGAAALRDWLREKPTRLGLIMGIIE